MLIFSQFLFNGLSQVGHRLLGAAGDEPAGESARARAKLSATLARTYHYYWLRFFDSFLGRHRAAKPAPRGIARGGRGARLSALGLNATSLVFDADRAQTEVFDSSSPPRSPYTHTFLRFFSTLLSNFLALLQVFRLHACIVIAVFVASEDIDWKYSGLF